MKLAADENFHEHILQGLLSRSAADVLRVRSMGLEGTEDPRVLAWAAVEGRVLLTHDIATMPDHASERMAQGLPMSGVICVPRRLSVREAIEQLVYVVGSSLEGEYENRILFLPLF